MKLSTILTLIMTEVKGEQQDAPFGGLNIVLCGDFHQFPPVMGGPRAMLYWLSVVGDSGEEALGSALYQKFDIVIILKEQMQVTDEKWIDLLCHACHGMCTEEHINLLKALVLSSKACAPMDFSKVPWNSASLITPHHGVCVEWNKAALKEHCH